MLLMTPLVVIAAFRSGAEAEQARRQLAGQGVAADVLPRNPNFERQCADLFDDGFDVVVAPEIADDAIAIVQGLWPDELPEGPQTEQCRDCGSNDVAALPRLRFFAIAALLLLIAGMILGERDLFALVIAIIGGILLVTPNRRCRTCGSRWNGQRAVAAEDAVAPPEVTCPKCASRETEPIARRREKALTLLVNLVAPPLLFIWPFLPRRRCTACAHQWR